MSDHSRDLQAPIGRFGVICALAVGACGWTVGRPPVWALTVGPVDGAAVEPGLRAELEDALVTAARRRAIPSGGPVVRVRVLSAEDRLQAGAASASAWDATLTVAADVDGGCAVEVTGQRAWIAPAATPETVPGARADAWRLLAAEVADRTLDALLAECR